MTMASTDSGRCEATTRNGTPCRHAATWRLNGPSVLGSRYHDRMLVCGGHANSAAMQGWLARSMDDKDENR